MRFFLLLIAGVALQNFHLHFHMGKTEVAPKNDSLPRGIRGLLQGRGKVAKVVETADEGLTADSDEAEDADDSDENEEVSAGKKLGTAERFKSKLQAAKSKLHRSGSEQKGKKDSEAAHFGGSPVVLPQSFLNVLASFMRSQNEAAQTGTA